MRLIDADLAMKIADTDLDDERAGVVQYVLLHTPTINPEDLQNEAFDLGYQSCLRDKGLQWTEAEELQRYRKLGTVEQLSEKLRPKGKWEFGVKHGASGYWCSNCESGFTGENAEWIAKEHDYCPNCGAKMED